MVAQKNTSKAGKTKKTSSKKTATSSSSKSKKTVRKSARVKYITLGKTDKDKYFVTVDGVSIGHFVDLAHELKNMSKEVFAHHVNDARHDFSTWIRDVFEETALAEEVAKHKDKDAIQTIIYKYVVDKHIKTK